MINKDGNFAGRIVSIASCRLYTKRSFNHRKMEVI